MVVKKFEARSMKEALEMIKSELGPEAIIIGARDNSKNYGLVGDGSVEITAAIQEMSLKKKNFAESRLPLEIKEKLQKGSSKQYKEFINKVMMNHSIESNHIKKKPIESRPSPNQTVRVERTQRYIDMIDDVEPDAAPNGANERLKIAAQNAWKIIQQERSIISENKSSKTNSSTLEKAKSITLNNNPNTSVNPLNETNSYSDLNNNTNTTHLNNSSYNDLKNEITDLKKLFNSMKEIPQFVVPSHPGSDQGLRYELSYFYEKLLSSGINKNIVVSILREVQDQLSNQVVLNTENRKTIRKAIRTTRENSQDSINTLNLDPSLIQGLIARVLARTIKISNPHINSKIEVFIGAGGHGKTTSLIKRASALVLNHNKTVAILSTDTKKLGADEQLKIYSQILNVPFKPIHSSFDWNLISEELDRFDTILVDTPGVRFRSNDEIQELKSLLPPLSFSTLKHLVISATSKDPDANEIGKRFSRIGFDDIIFTALDESIQHGVLINFQNFIDKPFHSFGIGPKIPDDFEPATVERVIDLIIGSSIDISQHLDLNL